MLYWQKSGGTLKKEYLLIKERHYRIYLAKQKLVYAELDRMLGLVVIEESNSSCSYRKSKENG